jgi:hypothetical protein
MDLHGIPVSDKAIPLSFHVATRYDICQAWIVAEFPFAVKEFSEADSSPEPVATVLQDLRPA